MEYEHNINQLLMQQSYEEIVFKLSNSNNSTLFSPLWFNYSTMFNTMPPRTPTVRHNFKSIDELLSPSTSISMSKTGKRKLL